MRRLPMVMATGLILIGATTAMAQTQTPAGVPPAAGRFTIFLNGGAQSATQDISRSSTFTLYEEQAQIDIAQNDIKAGGFLEVGGSFRFWKGFGAGASYTSVKSKGDGTITGSIPHPLLFDQFRSVNSSASDLKHKEQAVHVFALLNIPLTEKLDVTVSAGPSFFNISQDFVRNVTISETPPFTSVTLDSVDLVTIKQNGTGFNVGADATYLIARVMWFDLGVGAMARYTRGEANFEVTDGESVKIKGGGFQFGGGVRVRF